MNQPDVFNHNVTWKTHTNLSPQLRRPGLLQVKTVDHDALPQTAVANSLLFVAKQSCKLHTVANACNGTQLLRSEGLQAAVANNTLFVAKRNCKLYTVANASS